MKADDANHVLSLLLILVYILLVVVKYGSEVGRVVIFSVST